MPVKIIRILIKRNKTISQEDSQRHWSATALYPSEHKPLKNCHIETLFDKRQYRNLLVSQEIYRQQLEMYQKGIPTIDHKIVSGPSLGKPKVDVEALKEQKKLGKKDVGIRNSVEIW